LIGEFIFRGFFRQMIKCGSRAIICRECRAIVSYN